MRKITSNRSGDKTAGIQGQTRLSFMGEVRDAVSARTLLLVTGVLVLQLGFILSYVGAFHAPKPAHVPVGVVAPAPVAVKVAAGINRINGTPLSARVVGTEAAARSEIKDTTLSAALVVDPSARTDTLLVASAGGASQATAVEQVVAAAEASMHRSTTVVDIVPLQKGDGRGLTGFYLVVGWLIGGYLCAALFGIAGGARQATFRRTAIRLLALAGYAMASGLGGAVIAGPVLGALTGHLLALWWLGALLVFAAGAVTLAFQAIFGVAGIALTVLLFVVLGNPSAGGPYQPDLLPPFWRALSSALPNGAGVDSVRRIVYFGAQGIGGHLIVIALYALAGTAAALLISRRHEPRTARQPLSPQAAQVAVP